MNYVISIINPEALDTLCGICAELKLPMTVVMHGRGTAVQSMMVCSASSQKKSAWF